MHKITLSIYRPGWFSLLALIHLPTDYSTRDALNTLELEEIVLLEWRGRITPQQILTWQLRDRSKTYALKLSLPVAVALWKLLTRIHLESDLQEVLNELTRALVNAGLSTKTLTYSDYA